MKLRASRVEDCIHEVEEIRQAIDELACTQDEALLATYGTTDPVLSSDSGSEEEPTLSDSTTDLKGDLPDNHSLLSTLRQSRYNWFEFSDRVTNMYGKMGNNQLENF